jgi:hypothetical protein
MKLLKLGSSIASLLSNPMETYSLSIPSSPLHPISLYSRSGLPTTYLLRDIFHTVR